MKPSNWQWSVIFKLVWWFVENQNFVIITPTFFMQKHFSSQILYLHLMQWKLSNNDTTYTFFFCIAQLFLEIVMMRMPEWEEHLFPIDSNLWSCVNSIHLRSSLTQMVNILYFGSAHHYRCFMCSELDELPTFWLVCVITWNIQVLMSLHSHTELIFATFW